MLILSLLIFAAPVVFAAILHMVAVTFDWVSWLKEPIDGGKTLHGKRIFGDSKTWRGIVLMVLFSIIGCVGLAVLVTSLEGIKALSIFNFDRYSPVFYGVLFGLGYTLAELPNSFWKRQNGIENGQRGTVVNVLIDQADSAIGCLLLLYPFTNMSLVFFASGCVFYLFLHLFFNILLFSVGLRKQAF